MAFCDSGEIEAISRKTKQTLIEYLKNLNFNELEIRLITHFEDWSNAILKYSPEKVNGITTHTYINCNYRITSNFIDNEDSSFEIDGNYYYLIK